MTDNEMGFIGKRRVRGAWSSRGGELKLGWW